MEFLAQIFSYVIRFIYELTAENYALTIILFTILTKAVLFPLSYKQAKSSIEIQKIKPKYDDIMKKYKNDKVKQNEEITKLYSEHKINPLGGCLPMLIQLPIVISIYYIVRQPLTYVKQLAKEEINIHASQMLNKDKVSDVEASNLEIEIAEKYDIIDMNMLGINLGEVPANVFSKDENKKSSPISLAIPILTAIMSILQIKRMQAQSRGMSEDQIQMQKSMNLTLPIISGVVAYTVPLALGIYWMLGTVIQIIQQEIINKIVRKTDDQNPKLLVK